MFRDKQNDIGQKRGYAQKKEDREGKISTFLILNYFIHNNNSLNAFGNDK
jgi:hypothetical protein